MADRSPKIMEMVVQELDRNPDVELEALYRQATEMDPSIGELSLRQFHARYPLQAKRRRSRQGGGGSGKSRKGRKPAAARSAKGAKKETKKAPAAGTTREEVRRVLLDFAGDFSRAETRPEIVKVLGDVDAYVDRIVKLVS